MLLEGVYKRFLASIDSKNIVDLRFTQNESIAVAQTEASGVELTRAGRRFILGNSAAITGIANITAFGTTATQWSLWNAHPTRTCFFETIGVYNTSGTPGVGGILLFTYFSTPASTGAIYTGATISSASGGNHASAVIFKSGATITTPAAPNWSYISDIVSTNVGAFPGSGNLVNRDIGGRIAIPPGQGLAISVLGLAGTTPLWAPFAEWVELEVDME